MATLSLVNKLPNNKIKYLQDLGIEYVVVNRNMDKNLAKEMKDAGIKTYAYIIGDQVREIETICYESEYFYGIYADDFNFDQEINCESF